MVSLVLLVIGVLCFTWWLYHYGLNAIVDATMEGKQFFRGYSAHVVHWNYKEDDNWQKSIRKRTLFNGYRYYNPHTSEWVDRIVYVSQEQIDVLEKKPKVAPEDRILFRDYTRKFDV